MARTYKDTRAFRERLADQFRTVPGSIGCQAPRGFKRIHHKQQRARARDALVKGQELPTWKRTFGYMFD